MSVFFGVFQRLVFSCCCFRPSSLPSRDGTYQTFLSAFILWLLAFFINFATSRVRTQCVRKPLRACCSSHMLHTWLETSRMGGMDGKEYA